MVITHNNKTEMVITLQDCLNLADKDGNRELIESCESIINNEVDEYDDSFEEQCDQLEDEVRECENDTESRENCLTKVKEIAEEIKDKIEDDELTSKEIIEYLKNIISKINYEF